MVIGVRAGREEGAFASSPPCESENFQELNQRGWENEGKDEGSKEFEVLSEEPASFLEDRWHAPSAQLVRVSLHHLEPATQSNNAQTSDQINASTDSRDSPSNRSWQRKSAQSR